MKTYETDLFTGGGCHSPITAHYEVEDECVEIRYITAPVWVEELQKFVMGDITPFIDEYAYDGLKDEIYQIVEANDTEA